MKKGVKRMDIFIYFILMMLGHLVFMFFMPGMHSSKSSEKQGDTTNHDKEKVECQKENKKLKEEVYALQSKLKRNKR